MIEFDSLNSKYSIDATQFEWLFYRFFGLLDSQTCPKCDAGGQIYFRSRNDRLFSSMTNRFEMLLNLAAFTTYS